MTRVLFVFGTRPEAIKLAPVIREWRRRDEGRCRVCVTAQHREMLDQVLVLFGIVPDYDLGVMKANQSPTQVAAAALARIDAVLAQEEPAWMAVQGDTTTTAAASLAAYYAGVRVAHVEAGLRSHDKWRPFPEEINRRVVGAIADLHFAPTESARENLLREGVPSDRIRVTGNPVIDALGWAAAQPCNLERSGVPHGVANGGAGKLILVTAHRRESFGAPLERICSALKRLALRSTNGVRIVYPVHRNPNVRGPVERLLAGVPNITLLPPLDYLPLVHLMKRAHLVLTDSGGLQEEAPALGVPVLVLRDVTERPEGVAAGAAQLVGTSPERIVEATLRLLEDRDEHRRRTRAVNPYGDGHAAERIVEAILHAN